MISRFISSRLVAFVECLVRSFSLIRIKTNQKVNDGKIIHSRKPRFQKSLGVAIILLGLGVGLYLSIRATKEDISLLARIPNMITTPGGDTQRNSNQYQDTVKLANQKNLASIENTSESYILIPEVVTETIETETISDPHPWSHADQEIPSVQNQESETEMFGDYHAQDNTEITDKGNTSENLLAELNYSLNSETSLPQTNFEEGVPTQVSVSATSQWSNSGLRQNSIDEGISYQKSDEEKEATPQQSKYGLAILNQMNAIANTLVVQTPKTGFFADQTIQSANRPSPSVIYDNDSEKVFPDQDGDSVKDGMIQRIPAGSILYGEVMAEVTSDLPGPVLVEITNGPYGGWRLIGQFDTPPGSRGALVSFDRLVNLEGQEFPVKALAIDGFEGQSLIASKFEPRLLQRYGPVFATSFISGLAESLAQPRSTLGVIGNSQVVIEEPSTLEQAGYAGLTKSINTISTDIANQRLRGPLITIQSGHPVGILFISSTNNLI
ncbi:MAG: DotG/IcmE/VirB10 family protein [Paracoccaceae bacterium]|nr:DotG/IcmE/VirB10 family protein [Paracoccaceae bacterium]MDE2917915.1 DotG/IcmE/VirB10 family protein [Paracoccaceae bacterium]